MPRQHACIGHRILHGMSVVSYSCIVSVHATEYSCTNRRRRGYWTLTVVITQSPSFSLAFAKKYTPERLHWFPRCACELCLLVLLCALSGALCLVSRALLERPACSSSYAHAAALLWLRSCGLAAACQASGDAGRPKAFRTRLYLSTFYVLPREEAYPRHPSRAPRV